MSDLVRLSAFDNMPDKSMAQDLSALVTFAPRVLQEAEVQQLQRLVGRLSTIGGAETVSRLEKSKTAEAVYDIQQERDWAVLINPQTGKSFRWFEFREKLATALRISTGTVGRYIKLVRYSRQVMRSEPGQFPFYGGIGTVGVMVDDLSAGLDGKKKESWAETVRPKTTKQKESLERCPRRLPRSRIRSRVLKTAS